MYGKFDFILKGNLSAPDEPFSVAEKTFHNLEIMTFKMSLVDYGWFYHHWTFSINSRRVKGHLHASQHL